MKLVIIRHAIAMEREEFGNTGRPDSERPLTDEGRRRMAQAAAGLASIVPEVDVLASSPLARAIQTADILARVWAGAERTVTASLSPESPHGEFVEWLRGHSRSAVVAVVGHEPHLGALTSYLLTRRGTSLMDYKKGGAALLEFGGRIAAGQPRLRWFLAPAQLRTIGG